MTLILPILNGFKCYKINFFTKIAIEYILLKILLPFF